MSEHDWISVLNRRWCTMCEAFQRRASKAHHWQPRHPAPCSRSTAYALSKAQQKPLEQTGVAQ